MLKGKIGILIVLGLLGMGALFLACAAPAEKVAAPGEGSPVVLPTRTPLPVGEKPIPGGTWRGYHTADPTYWSPFMGVSTTTNAVWMRVTAPLLQYVIEPGCDFYGFEIDTKGSLAESWEISADGLTYTFHLRKGVKFANVAPVNGREFVADDVKWSLETHMKTPAAPRREMLGDAIASIDCPDKYTVVIKTKDREADFLILLAGPYVPMLAPECEQKKGTLNHPEAVMGMGPFTFEEYMPSVRYTFKKNPTYYRANEGLPYLDAVHYTNIADASTSLAAFRAEKIDLRSVSRIDLPSLLQTNPNIYCYESEVAIGVTTIAFRTDKLPFSDVNLRRAVSMAIDRQAYIASTLLGYGHPHVGPIHSMTKWYLKPEEHGECLKYEQYNPEEARRLMAAAGYPGGLAVTLTHSAGSETAELAADFLTKAGFKVTMKPLESAAVWTTIYSQHSYDDMAIFGKWGGATIGPDIWVSQFYYPGHASNYSNVDDPVMTKMIIAQRREMDPVKRQQILNEIQRYEVCQKYYVHFPVSYGVTCLQPWVRDYIPHAATQHTGRIWERLWLTEDAPGRKK